MLAAVSCSPAPSPLSWAVHLMLLLLPAEALSGLAPVVLAHVTALAHEDMVVPESLVPTKSISEYWVAGLGDQSYGLGSFGSDRVSHSIDSLIRPAGGTGDEQSPIGRHFGECTMVSADLWKCSLTVLLSENTVPSAKSATLEVTGLMRAGSPTAMAITGGTGKYRGEWGPDASFLFNCQVDVMKTYFEPKARPGKFWSKYVEFTPDMAGQFPPPDPLPPAPRPPRAGAPQSGSTVPPQAAPQAAPQSTDSGNSGDGNN
eukprot:gene1667-2872_t